MPHLLVRRAGFLTSVQDLGRIGHRSSGVTPGGALDLHALRIANLLVGNKESAAGLEVTLGALRVQFHDEGLIAWCGGPFSVQVQGAPLSAGRPALVDAGEEVVVTAPANGARGWLALSGGIDVPLVLGSRSTDLRSGFGGFGGRALRDRDVLPLGTSAPQTPRPLGRVASWFAPTEWANTRSSHGFLRVIRGGEASNVCARALTHNTFSVSPESDRMGVRLSGPGLDSESKGERISEAVAPGTIQLPPGGQPILLLGDCQTIGGYPNIAHVITIDLPAAAQLRPGDSVRFVEVTLAEAQQLLREREREVQLFRAGLRLRQSWS